MENEFKFEDIAIKGEAKRIGMISDEKEELEKLLSIKFKPSDVILCTFPKTGTTLTAYIIYLLKGGNNEFTSDFLEYNVFLDFFWKTDRNMDEYSDNRVIVNHFPLSYCANYFGKQKYIVTFRKPESTFISGYSFYNSMGILPWFVTVDIFMFFQKIHLGKDIYEFYKEFWKVRNCDNVLLLCYEDFLDCPEDYIRKIANFLKVDSSEETIKKVKDLTELQTMIKINDRFDNKYLVKCVQKAGKEKYMPSKVEYIDPKGFGDRVTDKSCHKKIKFLPITLKKIEEHWKNKFAAETGIESYEDLRKELQKLY